LLQSWGSDPSKSPSPTCVKREGKSSLAPGIKKQREPETSGVLTKNLPSSMIGYQKCQPPHTSAKSASQDHKHLPPPFSKAPNKKSAWRRRCVGTLHDNNCATVTNMLSVLLLLLLLLLL